jgi:hypothetical protein
MNATPIILWMLPGTREGGRDLSLAQRLNPNRRRPSWVTATRGEKSQGRNGRHQP